MGNGKKKKGKRIDVETLKSDFVKPGEITTNEADKSNQFTTHEEQLASASSATESKEVNDSAQDAPIESKLSIMRCNKI